MTGTLFGDGDNPPPRQQRPRHGDRPEPEQPVPTQPPVVSVAASPHDARHSNELIAEAAADNAVLVTDFVGVCDPLPSRWFFAHDQRRRRVIEFLTADPHTDAEADEAVLAAQEKRKPRPLESSVATWPISLRSEYWPGNKSKNKAKAPSLPLGLHKLPARDDWQGVLIVEGVTDWIVASVLLDGSDVAAVGSLGTTLLADTVRRTARLTNPACRIYICADGDRFRHRADSKWSPGLDGAAAALLRAHTEERDACIFVSPPGEDLKSMWLSHSDKTKAAAGLLRHLQRAPQGPTVARLESLLVLGQPRNDSVEHQELLEYTEAKFTELWGLQEEQQEAAEAMAAAMAGCVAPSDLPTADSLDWMLRQMGVQIGFDELTRETSIRRIPAEPLHPKLEAIRTTPIVPNWEPVSEAHSYGCLDTIISDFFWPVGENDSRPAYWHHNDWRRAWNVLAERGAHDGMRDYLSGLPPWDGVPRIETAAETIGWLPVPPAEITDDNSTDPDLLERWERWENNRLLAGESFRLMLLAVIARTFKPGSTYQTLVVLIGRPGIGKSSMFPYLLPEFLRHKHVDRATNNDITNRSRERLQELRAALLMLEYGEFGNLSPSQWEQVKHGLTLEWDRGRGAYKEFVETRPRRCAEYATTDKPEVLTFDSAGYRRFLVVELESRRSMPLEEAYAIAQRGRDFIDEHREQLWAEALEMHTQGAKPDILPELLEASERAASGGRKRNVRLEECVQKLLTKACDGIHEFWHKGSHSHHSLDGNPTTCDTNGWHLHDVWPPTPEKLDNGAPYVRFSWVERAVDAEYDGSARPHTEDIKRALAAVDRAGDTGSSVLAADPWVNTKRKLAKKALWVYAPASAVGIVPPTDDEPF